MVKPIPEGYHSVTPYLVVEGAERLLDFLKGAFDAKEIHCMRRPDGKVGHADVQIGDSHVMLGEAQGEYRAMPCAIYLYVNDADASYRRAIDAGAKSHSEPADMFYGDRHGGVIDPSGNIWWIATHKEDVSPEEIQRRAKATMG